MSEKWHEKPSVVSHRLSELVRRCNGELQVVCDVLLIESHLYYRIVHGQQRPTELLASRLDNLWKLMVTYDNAKHATHNVQRSSRMAGEPIESSLFDEGNRPPHESDRIV